MLFRSLTAPCPDPARPAVVSSRGTTTWSDLQASIAEQTQSLAALAGLSVGLVLPADAQGVAALAALNALETDVCLLDDLGAPDAHAEHAHRLNLHWMLTPQRTPDQPALQRKLRTPETGEPARPPGVTILTSGTQGVPKAARHTWESLARPVRHKRHKTDTPSVAPDRSGDRSDPTKPSPTGERARAQCWLLSYRIHLYAGLQVMLQALLNHGTLVIPDPGCPAGEVVDLMHQASTDCASATPSYWRRLLLLADRARLRQIPLTQITLGGEVCDQQILDGLAETFPHARIAHIYATTELGRCFSVTDGRAGFPASYLDQPTPDGVELRVEDSQLLARSANAMHGYQSDRFKENNTPLGSTWFPTGDLVHIDQQRVYFAGRASEMINVGGNKVQPLMVENIIRALPEVADVRVYAKPSSIAGQLVACEVVACPGMESEAIQQAVANACSQRLAAFQRPRFIEVVDQIHLTGAGKTVRRND